MRAFLDISLVMSKARVVRLKRITIPRLELSAATVSVRLEKMINRELKLVVDRSFFWTDSTSVLKYVANSHTRFHTFVSNRFSQIHDCSSPSQWRYVLSKLNPADDASRGLNVYELLTNSRWKVGPPFLWQSEDKWQAILVWRSSLKTILKSRKMQRLVVYSLMAMLYKLTSC